MDNKKNKKQMTKKEEKEWKKYNDGVVKSSQKLYKTKLLEEAFAKAYKNNGYNATKAYIEAKGGKVSVRTGGVEGSKLLKSPRVRSLIEESEEMLEQELMVMARDRKHVNQFNAIKLGLAYVKGQPVARNENINVNVSVEDILKS